MSELNSTLELLLSKLNTYDRENAEFQIEFEYPLEKYESLFGKAYKAVYTGTDPEKVDKEYYAIFYDQKLPQKYHALAPLVGKEIKGLVTPLIIYKATNNITKKQSIAVILPVVKLPSLEVYLEKNGPFKAEFIINKVILPICDVLSNIEPLGFIHGSINLRKIYIDENSLEITLAECVSELSGYSQDEAYETLYRLQALPFAKAGALINVDLYALGIVCLYLYLGSKKGDLLLRSETIIYDKFQKGSVNALVEDLNIPNQLKDILKFIISDSAQNKISPIIVKELAEGKTARIVPVNNTDAQRDFSFNGIKYFSTRFLAFGIYKNWEAAKELIANSEKLIKWVESNLNDTMKAQKIHYAISISGSARGGKDEGLTRVLMALDPEMPIRLKNLSITIQGIGPLLGFGFAGNVTGYINAVGQIISSSLWKGADGSSSEDKKNLNHELFMILERIVNYPYDRKIMFGLERCLYELNPLLPCQSPILNGELIFKTEELLRYLDSNIKEGENFVDKHIIAFIAAKFGIGSNIISKPLNNYPEFATNPIISNLIILSTAQDNLGIKLKSLTKKILPSFKLILKSYHNKKTREKLLEKLKTESEQGILAKMLTTVLDTVLIKNDASGFAKAQKEYAIIEQQIANLQSEGKVYEIGYRTGLRVCVVISYIILTTFAITLVLGGA